MTKKLNLGCGKDVKQGYINLDSARLKGVDVVWNLEKYPWPFKDDTFDEVLAIDVLEHLSDKIKPLEELWRITKDNAKIIIQVPNWNCEDAWVDPTHKQPYTNKSFDFFDPENFHCKDRFYLTRARFRIIKKKFYIKLLRFTLIIQNRLLRSVIALLSQYFNGVLRTIVFELRTVKK
jgi:predicted SAM-dependent methyltransferase